MGRLLSLRTLTLLGAAVAGFLTFVLLTRYLNLQESQMLARLSREAVTGVMVAKRDIPLARVITPEDIRKAPWPKNAIPKGAFRDVKALEGRVAARTILAGEPVLEGHLAPKGAGIGLAAIIPTGKRAVAVRVNEVIGVAGFIKPGDLVDVIVTMKPNMKAGVMTKTVLQGVPVLAVGQEISREGGKPKRVSAVTLLVDPGSAEKLALASRSDIQLAMRNTMDEEAVSTKGITPVSLIGWKPPKPKAKKKEAPAPKPEAAPAPPPPPPVKVEVIRGASRAAVTF